MLKWFTRASERNLAIQQPAQGLVKKSYSSPSQNISLSNYFFGSASYDFAFLLLNAYYRTCGAVADGVDRLAKEAASIQPKILDMQTGGYLDHPVLDILKAPSSVITGQQYLQTIFSIYLITGNIFLTGKGINNLVGLGYVAPQYLNPTHSSFETLDTITVTQSGFSQSYVLQEFSDSSFYVSSSGTQIGKFVRAFNPDFNPSSVFGVSRLAAISLDIEQYLLSSRQNLRMLERGVTASGIISSTGDTLDDDTRSRLRAEIDTFYSGSHNAGRVMILDNGLQFSALTGGREHATDAEYQNLRKAVEAAIYRRLEIPTPLVSEAVMTYTNLETSNLMLYDNAVIPLIKTIYSYLQDILFHFAKLDPRRYKLTYDENEIPALALRKSMLIKDKIASNAYTYNEIRAMRGNDPLKSGGEDVYVLSTQVPVGNNDAYETPSEVLPVPSALTNAK